MRAPIGCKLAPHAEDPAEIEAVLDALERKAGCPPSVSRRASCIGARRARAARIVQELRQHGVDDGQVAELRDQLRSTEHERALEVWRKRFGEKPADRAAYAKQARFLASRGFAQDVIRRILGGAGDEE